MYLKHTLVYKPHLRDCRVEVLLQLLQAETLSLAWQSVSAAAAAFLLYTLSLDFLLILIGMSI